MGYQYQGETPLFNARTRNMAKAPYAFLTEPVSLCSLYSLVTWRNVAGFNPYGNNVTGRIFIFHVVHH